MPATSTGERPQEILLVHSAADRAFAGRVRESLATLSPAPHIRPWGPDILHPDGRWYAELEDLLGGAGAVVCIASKAFLSSELCGKEEVPYLLERWGGARGPVLVIAAEDCPWHGLLWGPNFAGVAGAAGSAGASARAQGLDRIVRALAGAGLGHAVPRAAPPAEMADVRVDLGRLPAGAMELFGRRKQIELLDSAWEDPATMVVSLVAWGGAGKSTLAGRWPERLAVEGYRGARRVYGWSFYSQGTGRLVTSADSFVMEALRWFGDPHPGVGSPWEKGERLVDLIRRQRTLLILDGLEPLQAHAGPERGRIQDPALATVIAGLARRMDGLCLITTRVPVADLGPLDDHVRQHDLERMSSAAGRALLRASGVRGSDAELEALSRGFGRHALALRLLAAYLGELPGQAIERAWEIPELEMSESLAPHARRVLAAMERLLDDGPELEVLRMLGLFDRPAEAKAIAAVIAPPGVPHLNAACSGLDRSALRAAIERLRRLRLVEPPGRHDPQALDAHPVVREHFGQGLRMRHPEAWREGNRRLYAYLSASAKPLPDTLDEMVPLYAAVAHGCQAGLHQEVLDRVFWKRIRREGLAYSWRALGAFGADTAALAGFFDPAWRRPVPDLSAPDQAFVLNEAGFCLRALGRLHEASVPMRAGLQSYLDQGAYLNAAKAAGNLSELYLTTGNLTDALVYARQGVRLADRSQDGPQRVSRRAALGHVLHQLGYLEEAGAAFAEAEGLQQQQQPDFPLLYAVQGFRYCELLLALGDAESVLARVRRIAHWPHAREFPLAAALQDLSQGRALMVRSRQGGGEMAREAARFLDRAVDGLRMAGQQHELPRGLVARAELMLATGAFERARDDLDEALAIAARGGMELYRARSLLLYARLWLALGDQENARTQWREARDMVQAMSNHLRDGEVEDLAGMLGEAADG